LRLDFSFGWRTCPPVSSSQKEVSQAAEWCVELAVIANEVLTNSMLKKRSEGRFKINRRGPLHPSPSPQLPLIELLREEFGER
jgi:hypothetical protein